METVRAVQVRPSARVRRGRAAAYAILLALLPIAGGCQNGPGGPGDGKKPVPPSFEPVVFPHQNPRQGAGLRDRRTPGDEEAGWQEKWSLASRYAAGGFDDEALQVLDAALAHDPPATWAQRMRALKTSLRMRRAEESLLRVEARGVRDYVPFGRAIDFVIRFRNVSSEVITLLAPQSDAVSPSAMSLDVTRRDRDIYATQLKRGWNQTVFLHKRGDPPIRIPPGGVHEVPVRIPPADAGPPVSGLREIEVSGTLRPTRLRKGKEARTVRLPIRRGRVVALPRGFEALVEDPLASMDVAVRTGAPVHLLIAAEFVPPGRRAAAVEILARALAEGHKALRRASLGGLALLRDRAVGEPLLPLVRPLMEALQRAPERADALMEGLSTVTGVRLAPDPRFWKDWWRREEGRRTVVSPATPEGA